jgi:deoxycytidylate deaminase
MQIAKALSFHSTFRVRIGAVVVDRKSVVSVGWNKQKTHPIISRNNYRKLHAEISCVVGGDRDLLRGATMYVYRENLNGELAICKPCPWCQAILKEAGIREVFYIDPSEKDSIGRMEL